MRSKIWGWGSDSVQYGWKEKPGIRVFLSKEFALKELTETPPLALDKIPCPQSRLSAEDFEALLSVLRNDQLDRTPAGRLLHSLGKSTVDLLRARSGQLTHVTDAVVFPEKENQLKLLMEWAQTQRVALVPVGGGSSVVGGVTPDAGPHRAVVSVSMRRLNRLLHWDPVSRLATFEAGILGPELELELSKLGMTLGHFPQSFEFSTLGGWVVTRSSGQNSARYGAVEQWVHQLRMCTPSGVIETRAVPREAAGSSLKELCIGSEGAFGFVTQVTVKAQPKPATQDYGMLGFKTFEQAITAVREMIQSGIRPAMVRVSDGLETESFFLLGSHPENPLIEALKLKVLKFKGLEFPAFSAVVVGWEGSAEQVLRERSAGIAFLENRGGRWLGRKPGRKWLKERFLLPYLRDDLLSLGVLVETFETATSWSRYHSVHQELVRALEAKSLQQGSRVRVIAHLSHVYPEGGSIYFTVIGKMFPGRAIEQWQELKKEANRVIASLGAAPSHHHAIGCDHLEGAFNGPIEKAALIAVKKSFDPQGILNPAGWPGR